MKYELDRKLDVELGDGSTLLGTDRNGVFLDCEECGRCYLTYREVITLCNWLAQDMLRRNTNENVSSDS